MSKPIVVIVCMARSSESWEPQQRPHPWHRCAGGGAVPRKFSGMPIVIGFAAFLAFLLTPFLTSRFRYLERAGAIPIGLDEHHGLCFTTSLIALPALDLNLYRKATKQASFSDLRE